MNADKHFKACPGGNAHQTLFLQASKSRAVLVKRVRGKYRSRPVAFGDPHAALSWCIAHRAGFVFYHDETPGLAANSKN
jgi:hypothetical protein